MEMEWQHLSRVVKLTESMILSRHRFDKKHNMKNYLKKNH